MRKQQAIKHKALEFFPGHMYLVEEFFHEEVEKSHFRCLSKEEATIAGYKQYDWRMCIQYTLAWVSKDRLERRRRKFLSI